MPEHLSLSRLFIEKSPHSDEVSADINLERALEKIISDAKNAWPTISVTTEKFLAALASTSKETRSVSELGELNTNDLYLATACLNDDGTAIAELRKQCIDPLRPMLATRFDGQIVDDAIYQMEIDLLVGLDKRAPTLNQFSGKSSLKTWLRTVAMRTALQLIRNSNKDRQHTSDEKIVEKLTGSKPDPELEVLQSRYKVLFKACVSASIESLDERSKSILQQYYVHGLTFNQMAKIYGVDPSRPSRWLKAARTKVLQQTRSEMMNKLNLSGNQLQSLMLALDSQIGLSLTRLLGPSERD